MVATAGALGQRTIRELFGRDAAHTLADWGGPIVLTTLELTAEQATTLHASIPPRRHPVTAVYVAGSSAPDTTFTVTDHATGVPIPFDVGYLSFQVRIARARSAEVLVDKTTGITPTSTGLRIAWSSADLAELTAGPNGTPQPYTVQVDATLTDGRIERHQATLVVKPALG